MSTPFRGIPDSARQKDDLSIRRVFARGVGLECDKPFKVWFAMVHQTDV